MVTMSDFQAANRAIPALQRQLDAQGEAVTRDGPPEASPRDGHGSELVADPELQGRVVLRRAG